MESSMLQAPTDKWKTMLKSWAGGGCLPLYPLTQMSRNDRSAKFMIAHNANIDLTFLRLLT